MKLSLMLSACLGLLAAAAAGVPASAADPVVLKFGITGPARTPFNTELFPPWAEKVAAASQGTLKIEVIPGGVLGTEGQMIERVENGVADIGLDLQAYYGAKFALTDVVQLPLMFERATSGSVALWRVYQNGLIAEEYKGLKVLALTSPPPALLMTKGPVAKFEDLKGMKIATGGRLKSLVAEAVGSVPVTVTISDVYQSVNRGVVNGWLGFFTAVAPFKLQEVIKYYVDVPLGGSAIMVFMSQKRFDQLPEAARKAIDAVSGEALSADFGRYWERQQALGRDFAVKSGGTVVKPTEAELARWRQATDKVTEDWARSTPNGPALVSSFRAEAAKAQSID